MGFSANKQTKTKTKTKKKNPKAFRIKALQPPNQNVVNVKEVLEQSVIRFSQVQIRYIYIYIYYFGYLQPLLKLQLPWDAIKPWGCLCLSRSRCIFSISTGLLCLIVMVKVSAIAEMDWWCLTHSATYCFCKLPWAVFLLNWFFNGRTNQCPPCPPLFSFCIFYLIS